MHPSNTPGPAATPPPDAGIAPGATNAEGTNYLFYTATDGTVQMKSLDTGAYASAGGRLVSAPSAIVTAAGHEGMASFIVFGQGTDGALWYTTCLAEDEEDFSCSGSWASLGGTITSGPSAVVLEDDDAYSVYARGLDGAFSALCLGSACFDCLCLASSRLCSLELPADCLPQTP